MRNANSVALLRFALRQLKQLPEQHQRAYYRHLLRSEFRAHLELRDASAIAQLHERARISIAYIVDKYAR